MKTKEEYIEYLHIKLDEWSRDIDTLKEKVNDVDQESRAELDNQIGLLKMKRNELGDKINDLRQSGAGAWEDMKSGIDLAGDAMSAAVKSATSRFFNNGK